MERNKRGRHTRVPHHNPDANNLRMNPEQEQAVITAFVLPERRERIADLLSSQKRRGDVLKTLGHFRSFDPRWMVPIEPRHQQATSVELLLRRHGAGHTCYVIAENPALDGKELPLGDALRQTVGCGYGTIISCVPGILAYFEGEGPSDRYILHRPAASRNA